MLFWKHKFCRIYIYYKQPYVVKYVYIFGLSFGNLTIKTRKCYLSLIYDLTNNITIIRFKIWQKYLQKSFRHIMCASKYTLNSKLMHVRKLCRHRSVFRNYQRLRLRITFRPMQIYCIKYCSLYANDYSYQPLLNKTNS